ncbi:hypothetical protein CHU98_g7406 [Xylaria longipes]|nr:hypothetical protein CHU98_g7406 [Xylaria longipes]
MADTLRGAGLFMADRALETFTNDPQQLDRARSRFDKTPPPYRSYSSGTTTRSQSPDQLSEEQRWIAEQRIRLRLEYGASLPSSQFRAQVIKEKDRVFEAHDNRIRRLPPGTNFFDFAEENVKQRWIEQGIWNHNWKRGSGLIWRWKHEEPLQPQSELQTELQTKIANLFSLPLPESSEPRANEQDSEEIQKTENARAIKEREREASRPFHQFVYQISKQREWIQEQLRHDGSAAVDAADINTTAYEKVKNAWMEKGIWDRKWGLMPGMSWKHEQPLEEWIEQEMSEITYPRQTSPPGRDSPVTFNEMNLRRYRSVSSSPAEPNQKLSSVTNLDHQVLPMVINPPRSVSDTTHNSSSRQTTPPPPPKEKRRPGRPSRGNEKPRPDLPPQDSPIPPRRSKRLQEAKPAAVPDTVADSTGQVSRRGRPKRGGAKVDISAQAAPAKDSRVSKRQRRTRN